MKCTNWWPWKRCSAPAQKGSGRGLGLGPGSRAPKAARRAVVGLGPKARRSSPPVEGVGPKAYEGLEPRVRAEGYLGPGSRAWV